MTTLLALVKSSDSAEIIIQSIEAEKKRQGTAFNIDARFPDQAVRESKVIDGERTAYNYVLVQLNKFPDNNKLLKLAQYFHAQGASSSASVFFGPEYDMKNSRPRQTAEQSTSRMTGHLRAAGSSPKQAISATKVIDPKEAQLAAQQESSKVTVHPVEDKKATQERLGEKLSATLVLDSQATSTAEHKKPTKADVQYDTKEQKKAPTKKLSQSLTVSEFIHAQNILTQVENMISDLGRKSDISKPDSLFDMVNLECQKIIAVSEGYISENKIKTLDEGIRILEALKGYVEAKIQLLSVDMAKLTTDFNERFKKIQNIDKSVKEALNNQHQVNIMPSQAKMLAYTLINEYLVFLTAKWHFELENKESFAQAAALLSNYFRPNKLYISHNIFIAETLGKIYKNPESKYAVYFSYLNRNQIRITIDKILKELPDTMTNEQKEAVIKLKREIFGGLRSRRIEKAIEVDSQYHAAQNEKFKWFEFNKIMLKFLNTLVEFDGVDKDKFLEVFENVSRLKSEIESNNITSDQFMSDMIRSIEDFRKLCPKGVNDNPFISKLRVVQEDLHKYFSGTILFNFFRNKVAQREQHGHTGVGEERKVGRTRNVH